MLQANDTSLLMESTEAMQYVVISPMSDEPYKRVICMRNNAYFVPTVFEGRRTREGQGVKRLMRAQQ